MIDTTPCPSCRSPVSPEAVKCPHCQTATTRFGRLVASPYMRVGVITVFMCSFWLYLAYMVEDMRGVFRERPAYKSGLVVTFSKIRVGGIPHGVKDMPYIVVCGECKNASATDWENIQYEVKVFNKKKELLMCYQKDAFGERICSGNTGAFMLAQPFYFGKEEVGDHTIRVTYADAASP